MNSTSIKSQPFQTYLLKLEHLALVIRDYMSKIQFKQSHLKIEAIENKHQYEIDNYPTIHFMKDEWKRIDNLIEINSNKGEPCSPLNPHIYYIKQRSNINGGN